MSNQLRRSSLHTLGWWLQTSTLMAVITVMFQKRWEIPEAQIKPKAVLIWWISSTLFKNSSSYLPGFLRRWWLEHYIWSIHLLSIKKTLQCLNQYGWWDSRFAHGIDCSLFGPRVSMQTGFSKCLLWVFTFYLMHSDDTESKHIHTVSTAQLYWHIPRRSFFMSPAVFKMKLLTA